MNELEEAIMGVILDRESRFIKVCGVFYDEIVELLLEEERYEDLQFLKENEGEIIDQ